MIKVNRNYLFGVFCVVIFCIVALSIAYAALNTSLKITGSADVVASSWDVHFEDASFVSSLSSNNTYEVMPLAAWEIIDSVTITSDNTITFITEHLKVPGDYKIIQFDVVNDGTIDAKLENTVLSNLTNEQDLYIDYYVQYEDGTIPTSNDILNSGERKTLNLVIEFDKDVDASQLPTTSQNLSLTYTMNYVQK